VCGVWAKDRGSLELIRRVAHGITMVKGQPRQRAVFLAAFVTLAAGLWSATSIPADEPPASENVNAKARAPAVAGRFYPNEAEALELAVRGFLADAVAPRGQRPVALIAPHAGYIYSAQIAADAYRQAMEHDYDLVVILGTNHTEAGFGGVSVHPGPGYRTPLGVAEIDEIVAAALIEADPAFTFEPAVHRREHSVEVQIPFVQIAFPEVKIVTAVIGRPDPGLCARFGKALAKVLDGRAALIVASSDFSHYPAYDDAKATDLAVLDAIADLNPRTVRDEIRRQMARDVPGLATCACGEAPILAAIAAARALGATHGCLISYANSGDSPLPDRSRVVGYGAMAMIAGACPKQRAQKVGQTAPLEHRPLDALAGRELLAFARESISAGRFAAVPSRGRDGVAGGVQRPALSAVARGRIERRRNRAIVAHTAGEGRERPGLDRWSRRHVVAQRGALGNLPAGSRGRTGLGSRADVGSVVPQGRSRGRVLAARRRSLRLQGRDPCRVERAGDVQRVTNHRRRAPNR
jgi:AmmeMemoRadiSam system protein B